MLEISNVYAKDVVNVKATMTWVCIELGGELNFNLVSVYSPYNLRERAQMWNDLSFVSGNCILCGDFNMVEFG